MARFWHIAAGTACVILLAAACGTKVPNHTGDLQEVRSHGVLRVLTRPGFANRAPEAPGRVHESAMLQQLASRLGVELQLTECRRHDELLQGLREGRGDLAVARFSPAALFREGMAASAAVDWVEDLVLTGRNSSLRDLESLAGRPLFVSRSYARWFLGEDLVTADMVLHAVPEDVRLEAILDRVAGGRYLATVADSAMAQSRIAEGRLRSLGHLSERRSLVWAMRPGANELRMAVDDFLFAEQVLARTVRTSDCRDLAAIRKMGVLRLVTRNSPTTCTVDRGGLEGFEYDLAYGFAKELGLRLELTLAPHDEDPVDWLEQGYGDLAALHEPVAPSDRGRFLVSASYREVDLVAVSLASRPPLWSLDAVSDLPVIGPRAAVELSALVLNRRPLVVVPLKRGADALFALRQLERGSADVAVVDSDTARLELPNRPALREGPVVVPNVQLAWLVNPSSPRLFARVNEFLRRSSRSGFVRQLVASELRSWQPYVPPSLPSVPEGALTPYDEVLQWAGREHGIDWRLLASLMYEESRFDPNAVGPGGSAGLFQFMPFTWRELGVEDPHHPGEAVEAGATYLSQLMDYFADLPMRDRVAMAIASYNVGPRHVFDARRLATEMGLDADVWSRNVETAMVILDDAEVARRFPAGVCRCRRAVGYTRRILRRYAAYAEQFPPR